MKKILIGFAAAVVIGGTVLALPQLVDWNNYRDEIARRVAAATGQEITIDGSVGLRLLPAPALTLSGFHIRAPGRSDVAELVALKRLDVRVALMPLLGGHIQVENVVLVEPQVAVTVDGRGTVNWNTAPLPATPESAEASTGPTTAGSLIVKAMSFDQVLIENGRFEYRDDRVGSVEIFDKVDLRVVAGSLTGPFQVSGGVTWRGTPLALEAATGRFLESTAVPVRATLSRPHMDPDRPPTLRFAGIVGRNAGGAPRLQGDIRAEGADLRAATGLAADDTAGSGDPIAKPFSLRATIEASPDRLKIDNADALLGETHLTGAGSLAGGELSGERTGSGDLQLTLTVSNLNLDPWLAARRLTGSPGKATAGSGDGNRSAATARANGTGSAGPGPASPPSGTPPSGTGTGAATAGLLTSGAAGGGLPGQGLSLPAGLRGRIDVALDGASWHSGTVNQGRLEATIKDGMLNIDRVSARLPGNTGISAAGDLSIVGGVPRLTLETRAETADLRALLGWLQIDTEGVRDDRLHGSAISARIVAKPDRVDLTDVSLTVDDSRATAAVAAELRQRPALGIRFDVDRLNLNDYWLPAWSRLLRQSSSAAAKPLERFAAREATLAQWLSAADVTLQVTAPKLTISGVTADQFRLDATVAGGGVDIREASAADVGGMRLRLSGQAGSLSPLTNAHFTLSAEADALDRVLAGVAWPDYLPPPSRLGRATVEARLAGDLERTAVEARAGLAGATLQIGGTVARLPALFTDGEAGGSEIDVTARLGHDDATAALALVGLLPPAGPGALDLYAQVGGDTRRLALNDIRGSVGGAAVAGVLRLDRQSPHPAISGNLELNRFDLDPWLDSAPAAGSPPPAATGESTPATGSALPSPVPGNRLSGLTRFDGRLNLTIDQVLVAGITVRQAAAVARLTDGTLQVDRFDGMVAGGRIGGRASLSAATADRPTGFALSLTGQGLKPDGDSLRIGSLTLQDGIADVEIDLQSAAATTAGWRNGLQGKGRIAMRDGMIDGIDLPVVRAALAGADTPQSALDAAARGLQGGRTGFASLDGSCTITDGVVASDNLRLESDAGSLALSGRVDTAHRQVDATLTIDAAVDPPLPLALELHGAFETPVRVIDISRLQRVLAERAAANRAREKN